MEVEVVVEVVSWVSERSGAERSKLQAAMAEAPSRGAVLPKNGAEFGPGAGACPDRE